VDAADPLVDPDQRHVALFATWDPACGNYSKSGGRRRRGAAASGASNLQTLAYSGESRRSMSFPAGIGRSA
jgi:hypothetical protein